MMSSSKIDSSTLAAGRDVNIDTKHATRDIVYNYYLTSQHATFEKQSSSIRSSESFDAQQTGSSPPSRHRVDDHPKLLSIANANDLLLKVAKEGNIDVVNSIADHVVDINCTDNDGRTALHLAAAADCTDVVKALLSRPGLAVGARDKEGRTPFLLAALHGHTSVVEVLVNRPGVNINARDINGFSAVNHAAELGHINVLQLLLTQPTVDVNNKVNWGDTPLLGAVWKGEKESVRVLINHPNIDLNYRNKHNFTALELAVLHFKTEIAALIRDRGASPVSVSLVDVATGFFKYHWLSVS